MVQDVAYESLKLPGFIVKLALKFLSSQIEDKIHVNILEMKPIEFAKDCSVPCSFIIGNEDKLVYPKRVEEIFNSYLGKQKSIIRSSGDHSSERETYVIQHCWQIILKELKKNINIRRISVEPVQKTIDFLPDTQLDNFAKAFHERVTQNIFNSNNRKINKINSGKSVNVKYVFDKCTEDIIEEDEESEFRMWEKEQELELQGKIINHKPPAFNNYYNDLNSDQMKVNEEEFGHNINNISNFFKQNRL